MIMHLCQFFATASAATPAGDMHPADSAMLIAVSRRNPLNINQVFLKNSGSALACWK